MNPQLATRTMKARRETICPHCQAPIHIGQLIAKCGFWMHASCLLDHNRKTAAASPATAQPTDHGENQ